MLAQLDLHSNNLSRLPREIWRLSNLVLLNVSSNLLEKFPEPDRKITRDLSTSLMELLLADNRLSSGDLFSTLSHLRILRTLNIAYNDLEDVPSSIGLLNQLESLNVSGNLLTSLPDEIGMLKKLTRFYANSNKLLSVSAELSQCRMLQVVDLADNNLKSSLNTQYDWNWCVSRPYLCSPLTRPQELQ